MRMSQRVKQKRMVSHASGWLHPSALLGRIESAAGLVFFFFSFRETQWGDWAGAFGWGLQRHPCTTGRRTPAATVRVVVTCLKCDFAWEGRRLIPTQASFFFLPLPLTCKPNSNGPFATEAYTVSLQNEQTNKIYTQGALRVTPPLTLYIYRSQRTKRLDQPRYNCGSFARLNVTRNTLS
jgi:hypothetical protein